MDIQEFVGDIRDHYVQQFRIFISRMSAESQRGAAEVKLLIGDEATRFKRNYCADFVKNDDGATVVELVPDRILTFDPMEGFIGEVAVNFDSMCWDDITLHHDVSEGLQSALEDWFNRWFDPDENEAPQSDGLSGRVHCLTVHDRSLSVDFGTSAPEAFWELFNALADCGAKKIRISTSRAEQT